MRKSRPLIEKICCTCKKSIQVKYKQRDQKCCSLKCASLLGWSRPGLRKAEKRLCLICEKIFSEIPSRIKNGRGKYCSKDCYNIALPNIIRGRKHSQETRIKISQSHCGVNNPAYKDGSSNGFKRYRSTFPRLIREQVVQRDNFLCQKCLSGSDILVHHIDDNPLNADLSNLITWCRSCHASYHRLLEYSQGRR